MYFYFLESSSHLLLTTLTHVTCKWVEVADDHIFGIPDGPTTIWLFNIQLPNLLK